jgi:protein TonB
MTSTIQIAKYGTIDDLLFRGKNKSYGAYQLRQEYEHRLRRAFFLFMASLTSIAVMMSAYNYLSGNYIEVINGPIVDGSVYNPTILTKIDIDNPEVKLPAVAQDVNSIKLIPPRIVEEVLTTELNTTADILKSDAVISNVDNKGIDINIPSANPVLVGNGNELASSSVESSEAIDIAEIEPQFPGDLDKFLISRIEFPRICQELGFTKATVVVGFIVNEDGSVSNVRLEKSDPESFNAQALRAVRAMPKWIPGSNHGHKVKVNMSIPFNFVLDN